MRIMIALTFALAALCAHGQSTQSIPSGNVLANVSGAQSAPTATPTSTVLFPSALSMTGAQSSTTSLLYAAGVTITGTPTVPSSGLVSPMSIALTDNATLGTGYMNGLQIIDNVYTGTGGRTAIAGIVDNLGSTACAGNAGCVGVQGIGSASTNVGGTSGTTLGTVYGGNFQVYCNGTYFNVCNPVEDDIAVTAPTGNKFGHSIVMLATDTTAGTQTDTAFVFLRQPGAALYWTNIFDLSSNGLNSAIGANTTWLTSSATTSMTSLINATNVSFSGNEIALPGFTVKNTGAITSAGQISAASGSATTPGFSFGTGGNYGVFCCTGGNIGLSDNGTARITATATGVQLNGGITNTVRNITATGAITAANTDQHICINKTTGAASAVALQATPAGGFYLTVDDCKGDAATNNITITPNAGTIDGAATYVISTAYGSWSGYYTGSMWKTLSSR